MEEYYKREAIVFFRSLINYKTTNGKSTRPTNFAGHIGRHMKPDLKKWFLAKYPNNSDYVKFFLENEDVFGYDCLTGDVRLNTYMSRFEKPKYLSRMESSATDPKSPLQQVSKRISELEFFLIIFRLFVDSYESNTTIYISIDQLVAIFHEQKYHLIVKQISRIISKDMEFNQKIIQYLRLNYDTIFLIDEQNRVWLRKSVTDLINKWSKEIDETVYAMFKALIAKYLRCNGSKDVKELEEGITKRHDYIVNYLFHRQVVNDEFTLFDFVKSSPEDFVCKREVDSEGIVKRIIDVKFRHKENLIINSNDFDMNNIGLRDDDNSESDDEIYYEEDEQQQQKVVDEVVAKEDVDVTDGSNDLIRCCVCSKDFSDVLISYWNYREWALKHKQCLLKKLVVSLKKKCVVDRGSQTVSTGNVRPRQAITSSSSTNSNAYFHY